jgi:serine protease Do
MTKPETPAQRRIVSLAWTAFGLAIILFLYCIISDVVQFLALADTPTAETNASKTITIQYQEKPDDAQLTQPDSTGKYTVAGVAEAVSPSIVEITAIADNVEQSSGSGIILTEDGYLVTNTHVLQDCDTFLVKIDGIDEQIPAVCVGMDTKTDLAVLKIAYTGLPAAVIGDSDELTVGEEVVAIGNPAGLTGTVTNGIVSALHRKIKSASTSFEMDCIQTDAAISPGNSGGALINLYGQIVGITSSKYTSAYSGSAYEGLGFAISINEAMPIIEELIAQGYVSGRVRVGITFRSLAIADVREEYIETYNLPDDTELSGLWISEIAEDCDIFNSGLQVGDVIESVDGHSVTGYDDLNDLLTEYSADDTLTADCYRYNEDTAEKETFTITFRLMEDTSGNY